MLRQKRRERGALWQRRREWSDAVTSQGSQDKHPVPGGARRLPHRFQRVLPTPGFQPSDLQNYRRKKIPLALSYRVCCVWWQKPQATVGTQQHYHAFPRLIWSDNTFLFDGLSWEHLASPVWPSPLACLDGLSSLISASTRGSMVYKVMAPERCTPLNPRTCDSVGYMPKGT